MTWDLATAKSRLSISGTAQDVELQAALDTAVAIAERYLDRGIEFKTETAHYYNMMTERLFLPRYPVETISIPTNLFPNEYKMHRLGGYVEFYGQHYFHELDISYSGGYRVYPPDLELALWMIFDGIWPQFNLPVTGGAVTPGGTGAIASISVPDVGTIRFDNGGSAASSSGAGAAFGFIPATAVSLLEPYRRKSC